MNFVVICIIFFAYSSSGYNQNLKLVAEWKTLDFVFPRVDIRLMSIQNGDFIPGNCIPIDVDVDYQNNSTPSRIFVTIPRFVTGIPVTVGFVAGPQNFIQPYPRYSWHSSHRNDCDGIISVFRIAVSTIKYQTKNTVKALNNGSSM